jgi:outer membrane protein TolC
MKKSKNVVLVCLILILNFKEAFAVLLPEDYIEQVKTGNQSVKALQENTLGAELKSKEASIRFYPYLYGNVNLASDGTPTITPAFQGTKTNRNTYTLGLEQVTRFGTTARLSYNINYTEIMGVNPAFVSRPIFYDSKPTIELVQPIWQNGFGTQIRAQEEASIAAVKATQYSQSFAFKQTLSEAKKLYWGIVIAQEIVQVQKDALERAKKLRDWNANRVASNLADKSDLLQSEAALELRELELKSAQNDLRSRILAFNSLRGIDSDELQETLLPSSQFERYLIKDLSDKPRTSRDDIKASLEQLNAVNAQAKIGYDKNKPQLDLIGSYSWIGRNTTHNDALRDAFKDKREIWAVGLNFKFALNFGLASQVRQGYLKEQMAAEYNLGRKIFDENQLWKDLIQKLDDAKKRYSLAIKLESTQLDKLNHERKRLNLGLSTTYNVLMFEDQYANSQLNKLKILGECVDLNSQLETFFN